MKRTLHKINYLESIKLLRPIYERCEAHYLRKLKHERPELLNIVYGPHTKPEDPYFKAELTQKGLIYLENLKKEIS